MRIKHLLQTIALALMALCATAPAKAQVPSPELINLGQQLTQLYQTYNDALYQQKDFALAEATMNKMFGLFGNLSDEARKQHSDAIFEMQGNIYYDQACLYSLWGKKEQAMNSLKQACEHRWWSYAHAQTDHDLDNIRQCQGFDDIVMQMRRMSDYLLVLREGGDYRVSSRRDTLPTITYAPATDPGLKRVREHFRLDSVTAGAKSDVETIKLILTYIHNRIRHDGQHGNPPEMNSIALDQACADGSRGLNCRGLATVVNECMLAMGFESRFVTCFPRDYFTDCHVINAVFCRSLGRWIWIDPTHNAWVTDPDGNLLGLNDVRRRRIEDLPYCLNEEANWNNQTKSTKEGYLDEYMTKNLYAMEICTHYGFGTEQQNGRSYIMLVPSKGEITGYDAKCTTCDAEWFWAAPQK
ncbi:MAG: transglutaminase family protein [Muribaculaceae bacterium]